VIRDVQLFRDNPPDNNLTHEILVQIRQLKNTKAPGPDKIKHILLKQLPEPACQALLTILNNCLNASYFPKTWKTASTIMIPKPVKDPHNPLSYRPISLLNIMGKVLEKSSTTASKPSSKQTTSSPNNNSVFDHNVPQ
jgi:hypothetical protein